MPTNFDDPLGVDFHCVDDLDPSLTLVQGNTALGQSTARRLITPAGGLFYDRWYGGCVRRFLKSSGVTVAQVSRTVEAETIKDERADSAAAEVTFDDQSDTLEIKERITPVTGKTFVLTVNVDELSIEVLNEDVIV